MADQGTPAASDAVARPSRRPICGIFKATGGPSFTFEIPYQLPSFTIGRDIGCDQPLLCRDFVSKVHCKVHTTLTPNLTEYSVSVTDCSKNGVYVNGTRIRRDLPFELEGGSVITLGALEGPSFEFVKYNPNSASSLLECIRPRKLQALYVIQSEELGRGTFGTVVKAFDRRSGSPVAVKMIKLEARGRTAEEEEQKRATIKREVDLLARIQHPNIVTMETAMVENDCVYLVMEFAAHGNLGSLIQRVTTLGERDSQIVTQQLCAALLWLHNAGIIHRDVKPANILICSFVPAIIKIADFGLAKAHDARSLVQTMCGTPAYMAPEIFVLNPARRRYDFKVDSWSVGVTLIHMLSGKVPFSRHDIQVEQGIDNRVIRPEHLPSTCSFAARALVASLCERDPRRRISMATAASHEWLRLSRRRNA